MRREAAAAEMDAKTKRITALMQWISASPPGVLRAAFERELLQLAGVAPPAAPVTTMMRAMDSLLRCWTSGCLLLQVRATYKYVL